MNNPTLKLWLIKKFNLKFIPLLALTFILSNSYTKNIFAVNPPEAVVEEVAKLNGDLWHYRRDSLNTQNLNQILLKINPSEDPDKKVIAKVENILKDLYQGYFVGYANKAEKFLILRALSNFTQKWPTNDIIKDLEHKVKSSLASLDDLIKEFSKNYTPFIRKRAQRKAQRKGWVSKGKSLAKKTLNIGELLILTNNQQPGNIYFLPILSLVHLHAIKAIEEFQKANTEIDDDFVAKKEILINMVKDKIQRLKNYGWIGHSKIQYFSKIINQIKIEKNKLKQLKAVQTIIDLKLHKVSSQHAQLTYDLLYKILYL